MMRDKQLTAEVTAVQQAMSASAESCFDEEELAHLRTVIRLTIEFRHYLEHGSVEIAAGLQQSRNLDLTPADFREDVQSARSDPFNKYDLEYLCDSVRSGVDSFCDLTASYAILKDTAETRIAWGIASSREAFKHEFTSMFEKFKEEMSFEKKCRLLLDLFKLQIVFAGISCR
jgi:hypothetical protein